MLIPKAQWIASIRSLILLSRSPRDLVDDSYQRQKVLWMESGRIDGEVGKLRFIVRGGDRS